MRKSFSLVAAMTLAVAVPAMPLSGASASAATGDLSITVLSDAILMGAVPGDTVTFMLYYGWDGSEAASDVRVSAQFDPSLYSILEFSVDPSTQSGGQLEWNLGDVPAFGFDLIEVKGLVPTSVAIGSSLEFSASISGNVTESNPENNQSVSTIPIEAPVPDLWLWKWGLFEELEAGFLFAAEKDVPTTFNIYYFNWSFHSADNVVLTDSLPSGVEFLSAVPAPSSVDGQIITWNLGRLEEFASGEIVIRARPAESGSFETISRISTTSEETELSNNSSTFSFEVLELLPPRLLKPNLVLGATEDPVIVGRDVEFLGLARAGATVSLYDGSSAGCFGDFESCNPVLLGSATAGSDRTWTIDPDLDEARDYYLYLRAEKDGEFAEPMFGLYQPYAVRIDSMLDKAGFDLAHFTVETPSQTIQPNALGGSSGMTPNEDWTLNIRQKAPPEIVSDAGLLENHTLRLEIFDGSGQTSKVVPVTEVELAEDAGETGDGEDHFDSYDFIYVQKGFGAGSRVEIWCLPVFYTEEGAPIVGLVYVKCHEMLIDPAGYVYDLDLAGSEYEWPSVPPEETLIEDATVTALRRTGDDSWERWTAEESGQVNPQVTDETTPDRILVPGYYAFYVPPGQYQVNATAPGYADYVSPILTVIDAPVFHNVGMRQTAEKTTSVEPPKPPEGRGTLPDAALLYQNYPNPFNPTTTITYALMTASEIELTVHNMLGQEVARLVHDVQQPGQHHVRFDAGDLPSGVYFYRLKAGESTAVKKMTLVR